MKGHVKVQDPYQVKIFPFLKEKHVLMLVKMVGQTLFRIVKIGIMSVTGGKTASKSRTAGG